MIISTNSGKVVFYNPPNNQILLNISNDIEEFIAYFSVKKIDVEVSFCTAEQIKDLNYKFRKKDSETNVLSFPAESSIGIQNACCGEVIICYEVLNNEAKESSKNITNHFKHLLIHSLLHLLGYEHDKENDAILMESEEIKFLSKIGISDPYK
jgi:probable rRNA maturation factor